MDLTSDSPSSNKLKILVTFDIDGTILIGLNKGKTHHDAFKGAISDVFGIQTEIPKYRPGTDLGISKQLIEYAIHKKSELNLSSTTDENILNNPEIIQAFIHKTEEHYKQLFDGNLVIMPGIEQTLKYLTQLPNVKIGLCTGNFKEIALLKLEKANLLKYFMPNLIGGFGSDFESRTDILIESHKLAEQICGLKFDRFIHIGDSPEDVNSAKQINTTSILVRTTPYDFQSSEYHHPDYNFTNLQDNFDDFVSIIETGHATESYYKPI